MTPEKFALMQAVFPLVGILSLAGVGGWVITTWMRIKHGYPLDGAWGQKLYPRTSSEEIERIKLHRRAWAQERPVAVAAFA